MKTRTFSKSTRSWSTEIYGASPKQVVIPAGELPRRALVGLLGVIGGGLALGLSKVVHAETCEIAVRQPIQGPYYLGDPEEKYDTGSGVVLKGSVVDKDTCSPVTGATIVRWHANDAGFYEEFYRAAMLTKDDGSFEMSTIAPGQYAGLARHIHWYVTADGYQPVTDQIQWNDGVTIGGEQEFNFSLRKI